MSIEFKTKSRIPTQHGEFELALFKDSRDGKEHLLLCYPSLQEIKADQSLSLLVRIHSECLTGEVFGSMRCDCRDQLNLAMAAVVRNGTGAVVYLRQEGRGIGLKSKLDAYNLQDEGLDTAEANEKLGYAVDAREYSAAVKILKSTGINKVRLMTNNPLKRCSLEDNGIRVTETVPMHVPSNSHNNDYLKTKFEKMGHLPLK